VLLEYSIPLMIVWLANISLEPTTRIIIIC
jgi:hypothetical protein